MSHEVELEVRIGTAKASARLLEDEGPLLQDELVKQPCVLGDVPPPVVGKLEAGEVLGPEVDVAVVNRAIAVAADAKGGDPVAEINGNPLISEVRVILFSASGFIRSPEQPALLLMPVNKRRG